MAFRNLIRDPAALTAKLSQAPLNGVSAISSSVRRLEIAISSVQSRLLSLSSPPAAPALPTVAQALDVSLWTSTAAGYDPLYSEVAEQLCREHGLEPFVHSVTTWFGQAAWDSDDHAYISSIAPAR